MKTKILLALALLFTLLALAGSALAQDTNYVSLSADQMTKLDGSINNLIPLLPAKYQGAVTSFIAVLALLGIAGRAVIGWRNNGLFGVLAGLLGGTNAPKAVIEKTYSAPTPPKGATQLENILKAFLLFALPAFLITGCATHQVVNFSKGTGLNLNLPIGFNGANLAEVNLKFGEFYSATAIQPVSTNAQYVPAVAFASTTDGKLTAPELGGTNADAVSGGDKFLATIGGAAGTITNLNGSANTKGK